MSGDTAFVDIIFLILLAFMLFSGDPDIVDTLNFNLRGCK